MRKYRHSLIAIVVFRLIYSGQSFCGFRYNNLNHLKQPVVGMNLFWFGKGDDNKESQEVKQDKKDSNTGMGGTAVMMENLKQSQELGKKISSLLQDLSSTNVEGAAAGGKVKVFVDGQQQPIGVEIDKQYFASLSNVDDLNEALITAMQEAHSKSMQLMQEKMQGIYSEQLGISPTR